MNSESYLTACGPFEDNQNTDVALGENEFDTPGLAALVLWTNMSIQSHSILICFIYNQETP